MVSPAEFATMRAAKAAYNDFIAGVAAQRGWDLVDLDALLRSKVATGDAVRVAVGAVAPGSGECPCAKSKNAKAATSSTITMVGAIREGYLVSLDAPD